MSFAIDLTGFEKAVGKIEREQMRQIPFAISRTINAIAYEVQRDTIDHLLPEKFTLRNDWWRPGRKTGVNFFPSNKRQNPIKAIVNTLARFMEMQETGGVKTPKGGDNYVPVPTWNAQPDKKQIIRPNRRYRALVLGKSAGKRTLTNKGSWWITTLRQSTPRVAVRLLDDFRLPIATMYIGKSSVTIKPRFGFKANAQRICDSRYQQIFAREWNHAINTALN